MSSPVSRTTGSFTALYCCLGSNFVLFLGSVLPTSLASGPEISIELNVRGCFVIQLSTCFAELVQLFFLLLNCKSFYILSCQLLFVKHFFSFVFYFLLRKQKLFSLLSEATVIFYHIFLICQALFYSLLYFCQKEQKRIRRRRDLNPRTARTVYTLSRGASSATWVLLHMPKYNKIFNSLCRIAQRYIILAKTLLIVKL